MQPPTLPHWIPSAPPAASSVPHDALGVRTIAFGVAGLAAAVVAAIGSTAADLPTLCVFRRCTGGYCPGCGGTRAAASLAKGDLAGAWTHHPWVVLLAVQLIVVIGAAVSGRLDLTSRLRIRVLIANTALGIAIWIIRLATMQIPVPGLPFL